MKLSVLLLFMAFAVLTACSPSHQDYQASQKELAALHAKNQALTNQVRQLQTSLQAKTKELDELKQTPTSLLASAKSSKTDKEKISNLQLLISRYPEAKQADEAKKLLAETKSAMASAKLAEAIENNAGEACVISGKRLPPHFKGTDISSVIAGFKKLKPKGEFETTSSYTSRMEKEVQAVANPVQCVAVDTAYDTKYDADRKGWMVGIYATETYYPHKSYRFIINNKEVSSSTYVGSNAFGVTKSIDKSTHVSEGVTFPSRSFLRAMRASGAKSDSIYYKIFIPMSVDRAKAITAYDIKVLIRYKWTPDYLVEDQDYHSPTISEPQETHTKIFLLHGNVLGIVIFDSKSGDILYEK